MKSPTGHTICDADFTGIARIIDGFNTLLYTVKISKGNQQVIRPLFPRDVIRISNFREWCYETGFCIWAGGETDLQLLMKQIQSESRTVQIENLGDLIKPQP